MTCLWAANFTKESGRITSMPKKTEKKTETKLPPELKGKSVKMWSFRFDIKRVIVWTLILFLFLPALFSYMNSGVSDATLTVTEAMGVS